ncbi:conserved hypothetical protein [Bradyrhizobium oligotrophicum S58]|uniref:Uncharacterized protein n=1 Tax=Bradyrhizobium oligotrophicum S58 TaxID=1245469 RepID=M4ZFL9_9BRAD|nr:hypothetical protein [Bradyrhizobium oligotrophicum]BAM92647.1 conserved hypothetical protein [Bradyrhizobium oligotrophicum S58]
MLPRRDAFDGDTCPVGEELLGELYRADANGLPALVESVSAEVRVMLALFCYRRTHLHPLALAIASTCSEQDLSQFGGRVGSALYAQSRGSRSSPAATSSRKPISLSTKPLSVMKPFEDDFDDSLEPVTA